VKALYVTDREAVGDSRLRALLTQLSGAPSLLVQLRERESTDRECLSWAETARQSLGPTVRLFVNRRFDIALAAGADGVQLPADGLPLPEVRAHTPRGFGVGVSTHSPSESAAAIEQDADVVVLGPIFDTPSKRPFGPPLGAEALARLPLLSSHHSEVYAIGGLEEGNLGQLDPYRDRISGVAGIRLFQEAADPRAVVERIAAR
jgi:thiamine-phosphate pyrophosphorylase